VPGYRPGDLHDNDKRESLVSVHEPRPPTAKDFATSEGDSAALHQRVLSLRLPQKESPRGTGLAKVAWILVVTLSIVVGVLVALLIQHGSSAPAATAPQEKATADAQTASSGNIALDSKGYIIPVQRILVSPKVSGMIVELHILEGRRVKKGDVLAKLEDDDYLADVAHAENFLESARQRLAGIVAMRPQEIDQAAAELERAKAELKQLKSDFARSSDLYLRQKAVSQLDYELAESKYRSADQRVRSLESALKLLTSSRGNRVAATEADVREAEADLAKARWRWKNCTIIAPINGTILKKNAEEGNLVNPIAMNGSYSLCDLADLSDLEVELTIQERDISKVCVGQKCKVRTEAYPDRVYEGVVSRLMPVADRSKAAIPVRVKVAVPQQEEGVYLKPDMIAMVSFLNDSPASVEKTPPETTGSAKSPLGSEEAGKPSGNASVPELKPSAKSPAS
jgi:HlyD family secretion protein